MEPVSPAAVEIERYWEDNLLWLDRGERDVIVKRAEEEPRPGLLDHVLMILFGPLVEGKRAR